MKVGFVGLGRMGGGMAGNLLAAGHAVTVWNRTPGRAGGLVERGAAEAGRLAEACRGAAVVITMLSDDAAVEALTFDEDGLLAHLDDGAIHVAMSTLSVGLSQRLAAAHTAAAQRYVAAPVFGRPDAAAAGRLFVVAGGDEAALAECEPLFAAMGQRTFVTGAAPHTAHLVKLAGNFLLASVIESLGEAVALVGKAGVDAHGFVELLTSTLFDAPVYRTYGKLIADRAWEPAGFVAALGLKDVRLALAAADGLQVPLPLASLLRDRFLRLVATGGAGQDWSAIARLAAEDAGTP